MSSSRASAPPKAAWRGLLWPAIATSLALALLISLGIWQLQRLHWKEALLATIEARIHQTPIGVPAMAEWAQLQPGNYDYRHVTLSGIYDNAHEVLVFTGNGPKLLGMLSVGYFVLTPLMQANGAQVIINRGFIPQDKREPASRPDSLVQGPTTLTGLMRPPEARNFFTPADHPDQNLWFTRDPQKIASYDHLTKVAPFLVDIDPAPKATRLLPMGGSTEIEIPNNHFSYALTWFGFAVGLLGVFVAFAFKHVRDHSQIET